MEQRLILNPFLFHIFIFILIIRVENKNYGGGGLPGQGERHVGIVYLEVFDGEFDPEVLQLPDQLQENVL